MLFAKPVSTDGGASVIEFQQTILSGDGFIPLPGLTGYSDRSPILNNINAVWDLSNFQTARWPVIVPGIFSLHGRYPRILDLPIKMAGSEYRIPKEVYGLRSVLQAAINMEHSINPQVDQYHCYLTVDQGWVQAGTTQRREGCHVDGFQGARLPQKNMINRSYLCSDELPTVFYVQPFQTQHLLEEVHDFFLDFDRQAQESCAWRPKPGQLVLTDAYTVHRADWSPNRIFRTFVRVSYDVREFDRLGNTDNSMFTYRWNMVTRETQGSLIRWIP